MMTKAVLRARRGFTLVELLVVVSIIALLIAILLPSLSKARKQAKKVLCLTNLRSLSTGAFTYATEWGVYPPSLSNFATSSVSAIRAKRLEGGIDWLGVGDQSGAATDGDPNDPHTGNPEGFTAAPRFGALFPLVKDEKAYLCAEDKPGAAQPDTVLGGGGNGKFSYTMFDMMGLRPPERIPARRMDGTSAGRGGPSTGRLMTKPSLANVPLFVEEHPAGINNKGADGHMEGNFNFNLDKVVARHVPFTKRLGKRNGELKSFLQGVTQIGFADGHAGSLAINYGFTATDVTPRASGGGGQEGIPDTAAGLLYHFGIQSGIDTVTGNPAVIPIERLD